MIRPLQNKSLALLMALSQIVLTVFVVQWIISQYKNEKSELQKELIQQFEKSQQEVIDTLLEKNLITPLLKNKNGFNFSFKEEVIDTFSYPGKIKMYVNKADYGDSTKLVTIVTDTIYSHTNSNISTPADSSNNILLHGIRLFVKEVEANPGQRQEFERRLYAGTDSFLIKKTIDQNFKNNGWHFHTRWVSKNQEDTSKVSEKTIFSKKMGIEVTSYNFYLLQKIIPQSLFAIILLLLTGFAFFLSYRTLKNQLRLNEMKNDFIDNISHELKTPVSTVKVIIEALQEEKIRKDEKITTEYLEMASIEINRLELLTGKILSSSMMESGIIKMQKQKIELFKLISDLAYAMKVRLANDSAELLIQNSDAEYVIDADPIHVQGALLNLLDNSLKYSGKNPKIEITFKKSNAGVKVVIKDNGPGIPNEYLGKVFEKFFRVPAGNLHNVKGHGLGLSYVFMVMKMHGGFVSAENDAINGCIFTLTFPENVI